MNHCGKSIIQYSLDGKFIKEWKSAAEIERQLGFFAENISASCLKKSKKSNNYIWRFKGDELNDNDLIEINTIKRNRKKIKQLSKDGKLVRIFDSLIDAAKFLNINNSANISHVCNGRQKSYKGYKWEFL